MSYELFNIDSSLLNLAQKVEQNIGEKFQEFEQTAEYNQIKVVKAMQDHKVSEAYFHGTTGYGYGDSGRDAIDSIYAQIFGAEDALVRTQFVSGTHALNVVLWSVLRPGDTLLAVTGKPYDTLEEAIGISGSGQGSLSDFGIKYREVPLLDSGRPDFQAVREAVRKDSIKAVYIQRSKGYGWRPSLSVDDIGELIRVVKDNDSGIICIVDNCYGEFVEKQEPGQVGADLAAGSLIKNPGGGLAPTGAYIAGRSELIRLASYRLTSPGIGKECGATLGVNRSILTGLFFAPHIVAQSLKGAEFCAGLLKELGFKVSPQPGQPRSDIIQAVELGSREALLAFCQGIQKGAAVDSHVLPQPWVMPGYNSEVIMAAGTFIQGASIEMSADAPVKSPYTVYIQGGLTYAHAKLSILMAVQELINRELLMNCSK